LKEAQNRDDKIKKENREKADNIDVINHVLNAINAQTELLMAREES
jgi:CCR4-NOT transcriptional regulation complex NOT5 subunit